MESPAGSRLRFDVVSDDSAPEPAAPYSDENSVGARAPGAIAHMNADHADALRDICVGLGGVADATAAVLINLDAAGCDLEAQTARGPQSVRVAFPQPLGSGAQLRSAMVDLTRRARLGR